MKSILLLCLAVALIQSTNGLFKFRKPTTTNTTDHRIFVNAKIYSNLAEIITPLGKLPLEFSENEWRDIRPDSLTLVGANVIVTEQTNSEKKKPLTNAQVYVRSPSSSGKETNFVKATVVDDDKNLVKLIDKDISKDAVFLYVNPNDIIYNEEPPQSKHYVNFLYNTTDAVYVSYLRSNLNWKTRYQLNLFDDAKSSVLIATADIRNDGKSRVDIDHAELIAGDINLQIYEGKRSPQATPSYDQPYELTSSSGFQSYSPTVGKSEELVGVYVFPIDQPVSIDGQTNYLLPIFRAPVSIERYGSISKYFYNSAGSSTAKALRSYRLVSDRFLSSGNCIIRESDRLVGEVSIPNVAAKDKYAFSIGEDSEITYKENVTLVSTRTFNETTRTGNRDVRTRTESVYNVNVTFKNFKKNRPVKIEYQQQFSGQSVKLVKPSTGFTEDGSTIKGTLTLAANEEKLLSYKVEQMF